jgi:hypothetical protein
MKQLLFFFFLILFWTGSSVKQSKEKPWPPELNTAMDADYLDKLEREVIHELNKVRTNPKRFAEEYMEELRAAFDDKTFTYPGRAPVLPIEGIFPLNECIEVLKKASPMPLLYPAEGLTEAAFYLADDQQRHGGIGHISRDRMTPQNRIEKYGEWNTCSAEDITYGSFEARQIVIVLLIDDGVPHRSHRKNILNPCFRVAGVSFGGHPAYQSMCVIDYAGEYKTK